MRALQKEGSIIPMEKQWYYVRSTWTGQCYKLEFMPMFGGYVQITEAEYKRYCSVMLGLK